MNTTRLKETAPTHSSTKSTTLAVLGTAVLCALTACGGGGTTDAAGTLTPSVTNDCSEDGQVMRTAGNTAQIDSNGYGADGTTIDRIEQAKFSISGGARFGDKTGLLLVNSVNTTTLVGGPSAGSVATTTWDEYSGVVANERRTYGATGSGVFQGVTTVGAIYYTPYASTGAPLSPVLGAIYTSGYSTTFEIGATRGMAMAQTSKTAYAAEPVTVLAGTFAACKAKVETVVVVDAATGSTNSSVSYTWFVGSGRYKGLVVRTADGRGVKTSEATRLVVNGQ